ncbi:hypothetical protein GUJ93_ZPchr0004g40316 [Zizania palustris]|uniref:Uncharacterized protein n=1 Tax=Zizania palustris TaxID=103762 RepID=A0A8J5SR25_ZIZPA|nr:hypothetical protein GUJ93_ZPchr0004g40316 [Zizania palustris]
MIMEQILNGHPNGVSSGVHRVNDLKNITRDDVIEPVDQALINHEPLQVTALCLGQWSGEVGVEDEFANDRLKEAVSFKIVGTNNVECGGNMGFYVDGLERGGGGRWRLRV